MSTAVDLESIEIHPEGESCRAITERGWTCPSLHQNYEERDSP
jgi:hypothetical protein